MSEYFIPDADPRFVSAGNSFTRGEGSARLQYPGNWLASASAEELAAIGAVAVPDYDKAAQALERDPAAGYRLRLLTAAEAAAQLAADRAAMTVSPLQARRALRAAGLKGAVDTWLAGQPEETREAWEFAVHVRRDDPLMNAAGAALGMTDSQMDDLFRLAATL